MTTYPRRLLGLDIDMKLSVGNIIVIGTLVFTIIGGYFTLKYSTEENTKQITDISARVSANEMAIRRIDTHELRITNLEKAAGDASSAMRSLESTLNGVASDLKVTREILQRLEANQKARFQP